jgi:hypothetical protein
MKYFLNNSLYLFRDKDIEMIKNNMITVKSAPIAMKDKENISDEAFDNFINVLYPRKRIKIPDYDDYRYLEKILISQ